MKRILAKFSGAGVGARARRGALWTFMEFGAAQFLRLASNLLLTRLLFPEAFGLIAIVLTFTAGLQMFSETGIRASIIQNERGDDPDFLNTAWTMQIIRGAILLALTFAIASPVAELYDQPVLAQMLPMMGLNLFLMGFMPTALHTANRHMRLGRVAMVNLGSQVVQIIVAGILAYLLNSVWALVIAANIYHLSILTGYWLFLPGASNRPRLEREAFGSLFHFGKYLLLGTAAGFVINQSDRMILGLYVPLAELGVYNIGFFMATMPKTFASSLQSKVVFPLYRLKPIAEDPRNRIQIFRTRRMLASGMMVVALLLGAIGPWLIDLLYDERYIAAGPMMTLFSLSMVPMLTLTSTGPMLLSVGDSKRLLAAQMLTAVLQTILLFTGIQAFGVAGAILAPGLATMLAYPLRMAFARHYNAWDPVQDFGLTALGLLAGFWVCWLHWDEIVPLFL